MRYLTLLAAVWATTAYADEVLMDDTLKITVAQTGFAGVTGTIYEVDRLANFTVSAFVNDVVTEESSDVLSPEALVSLQSLLTHPLVSSDEVAPEINPLTITVNYQGQEWVVTETPYAPEDAAEKNRPVRALADWMATQAETRD